MLGFGQQCRHDSGGIKLGCRIRLDAAGSELGLAGSRRRSRPIHTSAFKSLVRDQSVTAPGAVRIVSCRSRQCPTTRRNGILIANLT